MFAGLTLRPDERLLSDYLPGPTDQAVTAGAKCRNDRNV